MVTVAIWPCPDALRLGIASLNIVPLRTPLLCGIDCLPFTQDSTRKVLYPLLGTDSSSFLPSVRLRRYSPSRVATLTETDTKP